MYQAKKRRRSGGSIVLFMFLCAIVVGIGAGYISVKLDLLPNKMNALPESNQASALPETVPLDEMETEAENAPVSITTVVPAQPQDMLEIGYFVQLVDGDVCVFKLMPSGETVYSHKLPIVLEDLRPEDKKRFLDGFRLSSKQELLELIEDFSS